MAYGSDKITQARELFVQFLGKKSASAIARELSLDRKTVAGWKKQYDWDALVQQEVQKRTTITQQTVKKYTEKKSDDISDERVRVEAEYRKIFDNLRAEVFKTLEWSTGHDIEDGQDMFYRSKALKNLQETALALKEEELAELGVNETQAVILEQVIYVPGQDTPLDLTSFADWHKAEALLKEQDPHTHYGTPQSN